MFQDLEGGKGPASQEFKKDKNYQAFKKDEAAGKFEGKGPMWVAYIGGELWDMKEHKTELFEALRASAPPDTSSFVKQVNVPEEIVSTGGPKTVSRKTKIYPMDDEHDQGGYGEGEL